MLRSIAGLCVILAACGGSGSTSPATKLTLTASKTSIPSGTSVQVVATMTDPSGVSTPATGVTWVTSTPTVAAVSGDGLVTGGQAGNAVITATSGGLTAMLGVSVVPGAPATVVIYAGNSQSGKAGAQLSDPLCTNVKDAAGNLIIGIAVQYTVMTGGGTLGSPTAPKTDPGGIATSGLWTLGSSTGVQTVTATVGGATSATFTATAQ